MQVHICGIKIVSTGSTKVVDHLSKICPCVPKKIRDDCVSLRAVTVEKRQRREDSKAWFVSRTMQCKRRRRERSN